MRWGPGNLFLASQGWVKPALLTGIDRRQQGRPQVSPVSGPQPTCFVRKDYQCFYGQISFKELVFEFPKDGARYTGDPSHNKQPRLYLRIFCKFHCCNLGLCSPPAPQSRVWFLYSPDGLLEPKSFLASS